MSSVTDHQQKHRSKPRQPLDRHMSEIGEYDGGVYINAGIDSTCSRKSTRTIHKLTDGIVASTSATTTTTSQNGRQTGRTHMWDVVRSVLQSPSA